MYIHDFGIKWLVRDLPEYLTVFDLSKKTQRFGGMTFPLQSGSDKILKAMHRGHNRTDAIRSLLAVRNYSFDIGTHIMIGFPRETNADFNDTLELLKEINFDFITCFSYSEHPKAQSADIHPKVSQRDVEKRIRKISELFWDRVKVLR